MKKIYAFLVMVFLLVFVLHAPAQAEDNALTKLSRGFVNILAAPCEAFREVADTTEEGLFVGILWGPFKGLYEFARRGTVGIYEVVTFPLPIPDGYGPILGEPIFFKNKE